MATDDQIKADALEFAKRNKKEIALKRGSVEDFPPDKEPVSIFMAGSPGAGKTETSLELIKEVGKILRIDPDELRAEFASYNGQDAHLFQGAVSILVEKMLDLAFKCGQSFLLDGTLTN